jgi:hypothetical protein
MSPRLPRCSIICIACIACMQMMLPEGFTTIYVFESEDFEYRINSCQFGLEMVNGKDLMARKWKIWYSNARILAMQKLGTDYSNSYLFLVFPCE